MVCRSLLINCDHQHLLESFCPPMVCRSLLINCDHQHLLACAFRKRLCLCSDCLDAAIEELGSLVVVLDVLGIRSFLFVSTIASLRFFRRHISSGVWGIELLGLIDYLSAIHDAGSSR